MRPSLPRRDGVGATDAESRGVCAFGLMERLVRVERPGGSIDGVGNDFQSFRNQRLGDGGPDFSQMEPTDQLDAANRRLPPGRVRRLLNRPGRSAPSRTAPSLAVSGRRPPERDSVLACRSARSPTRSPHNLQPGKGRRWQAASVGPDCTGYWAAAARAQSSTAAKKAPTRADSDWADGHGGCRGLASGSQSSATPAGRVLGFKGL